MGGDFVVTAEVLRRAAANIREDAKACGDGPTDLLPAIADLLDAVVAEEWCCDECKYGNDNKSVAAALAVARAYLGADA